MNHPYDHRPIIRASLACATAVALCLSAGCSRAKPPPPSLPAGATNAVVADNVGAVRDNGFVRANGRVIPAPATVDPSLWTDPAVQVRYASDQPGPQLLRLGVRGSAAQAAAKVEQGLIAKGWKRNGAEIRSGPSCRTWFQMPDGSMAEIVAIEAGSDRSEVQLTLSPMLCAPLR